MSGYPELEKLSAIRDQSQEIGEFLEWLEYEKHVKLMVAHSPETDEDDEPVYRNGEGEIVDDWRPPGSFIMQNSDSCSEARRRQREEGIDQRLIPDSRGETKLPLRQSPQQLLEEFFKIDPVKLEEERRQMLEACRAAHDDSG